MVRFISFTSPIAALLLLSFGVKHASTASTNTCIVANSDSDDAITIAEAFEKCKTGGTVVFPKDSSYQLNSIVTTSDLKNVNINFAGTIHLPAREESYRNGDYYIQIKGTHIKMYGGGTINGHGQAWYDALDHTAPSVLRIAANDSIIGGFTIINSPRAHLNVTNSTNLVLHDFTLHTVSNNSYLPKNTDALDLYHSSGITFRDSMLTIGDDCVAIKEDVEKVIVSNVTCRGGHGYSIGSLGIGGRKDYVKHVNFRNSTCIDCENGVRVKTWAGGKGIVEDINYNDIILQNVDNPILVTTHYCDPNVIEYCNGNDDNSLNISSIHFKDITGTASALGNPIVNVNCSIESPCSDITFSGIDITKASNTTDNVCVYLEGSDEVSECSS
ncbi:hypothetical protein G6F46_000475 [Rhizopus delemar]|uniref:Exopolygalacturonase rpg15 n=3 Tax=Rhizopus TaxID=4842 RepID=RPG15_RHIO9|nr:RecName: Full=Exopolygalacturonase rpg15; AltName: Full=Galacturan 1,4-alpha-galacturonidase rpg15; AltName: Full=Poly(1,4-alpha-D-galacturonide)galacturonohydrolase rpg15; Flags: Precursor [Rhizopus delemar RA 99-880]KAG1466915.1 hypothetical protein G6F55_000177 [Rhizopus delemar]KAG1553250.1 hypothetical protein G6F51_000709 [Rhizopus arrhizus]EIE81307.1 hypothetical protein RO3G_06012 [Rhizopus delemar RA 99-880]KAG1505273.1 hypothetical protein G6F54_000419 [Rhizopus delemar]KAG1518640|eukprot:EIE81307.1 hypothetical protein RO3G_06012 [Rhizopus delemar RA 99-880]